MKDSKLIWQIAFFGRNRTPSIVYEWTMDDYYYRLRILRALGYQIIKIRRVYEFEVC